MDYTHVSDTLIFAPWETSREIYVKITNDTQAEAEEQAYVKLSVPLNATLGAKHTATFTIKDAPPPAPPPTVQFASPSYAVSESGTSVEIEVTLSAESDQAVTVKYAATGGTATAGTDSIV